MKNSILLMAIIYLGLTVCSCQDENESASKKELLTNKTWKVSSKTINPAVSMNGMSISDIMLLDSEEVRNYTYKYNLDGTMIQYNQLNQNIFETKWSFNTDETQLIHNPGIIYTYPVVGEIGLKTITLESITADQVVLTTPYIYEGINYVITLTYKSK